MKPNLWRTVFFQSARLTGLFALCRWLYRDRQLILCYHAFSFDDEHRFRPQQFVRPKLFADRLARLSRLGYRAIPLADALRRSQNGESRLKDFVITIDDGFSSVHRFALPALRHHDWPATLYLTTYYVKFPQPVFGLALQYLLWKSGLESIDLDLTAWGWTTRRRLSLRGRNASQTIDDFVVEAEARLDEAKREDFLSFVATTIGLTPDDWSVDHRFCLITPPAAQALRAGGVDLQLHTHRHRFPAAAELIQREIEDNRAVLSDLGVTAAAHFCYPSGEWRPDAFPTLTACGVESATTCLPGLNGRDTHPLALQRFLDADDIAAVEFEAEISGFKQLLRDWRARLRPALRSPHAA